MNRSLLIDKTADSYPPILPAQVLSGDIDAIDDEVLDPDEYIYDEVGDYIFGEQGAPRRLKRRRVRRPIILPQQPKPGRLPAARAVAKKALLPSFRIPFLDVSGGRVMNAAIQPDASLTVAERKNSIQASFEELPYQTQIFSVIAAAGACTITFDSTAIVPGSTSVKSPFLLIKLAGTAFQSIHRTYQFQFTSVEAVGGSPLAIGNVDVQSTNRMKDSVDITMIFNPWAIVASNPVSALLGLDNGVGSFSITVPALADGQYTLTVVVPGTNHEMIKSFIEAVDRR